MSKQFFYFIMLTNIFFVSYMWYRSDKDIKYIWRRAFVIEVILLIIASLIP